MKAMISDQTGLDEHFSDVVGRIRVRPARHVNALYRFRSTRTISLPGETNLQRRWVYCGCEVGYRRWSAKPHRLPGPQDDFETGKKLRSTFARNLAAEVGAEHAQRSDQWRRSPQHGASYPTRTTVFEFRVVFHTFTRDRDVRQIQFHCGSPLRPQRTADFKRCN